MHAKFFQKAIISTPLIRTRVRSASFSANLKRAKWVVLMQILFGVKERTTFLQPEFFRYYTTLLMNYFDFNFLEFCSELKGL